MCGSGNRARQNIGERIFTVTRRERTKNLTMKTIKPIRKIITALLVFAVVFTSMPAAAGTLSVHAASPYWKNFKARTASEDTVKLSWKALTKSQKKKISGIAVFRNGKVVKRLKRTAKSYTDKKTVAGKSYSYQLKTYRKNGKRYKYSNVSVKKRIKIPVDENLYPAPKNLRATVNGKNADLTWDAVENADKYRLYIDGELMEDTEKTSTRFRDEKGTYIISVSAIYGKVESKKTKVTVKITGKTEDTPEPVIPDPQPEKEKVQITDYEGNTITVYADDPKVNNPIYNREVDGIFQGKNAAYVPDGVRIGERYFLQKNSVTFCFNHYNGGYDVRVYNGDPNKVKISLDKDIYEYNKWDPANGISDLENPVAIRTQYIMGDTGRRLADLDPFIDRNRVAMLFEEYYIDKGSVRITASYDGEVIDTFTLTLGSDKNIEKFNNWYKKAKEAVDYFKAGNSCDGFSHEHYMSIKQGNYGNSYDGVKPVFPELADYIADMNAIEAYVWENYTYSQLNCAGGRCFLMAYSIAEYGLYGHSILFPDNRGHEVFRPDIFCDNGCTRYFETNGHY